MDDAIAILLALSSPSHHFAAITCVSGNVHVDQVIRNVPIVLDAVGADEIPIFRGAADPLHTARYDAARIHGSDGLGDVGFPPSRRPIEKEDGVGALVRMARSHPREYDLVTLGPLTNIALAIAMAPDFPNLFNSITVMGGATRGMGNVTAAAEFNIYADPEAAAIVFDRARKVTLMPWEICIDCLVPFGKWDLLTGAGTLGRNFVRPMTAKVGEALRSRGLAGISLPDPLAMAVALDEKIAITRQMRVEVETGGRLARGLTTTVDPRRTDKAPNAQVVTAIDQPKFHELLERCFGQANGLRH